MKKIIISLSLIVGSCTLIGVTTQSCTTLATTDVGMSVVKGLLIRGINNATSIYQNEEAFLNNNTLNNALPPELVKINSVLKKISPNLVEKEKKYIAKAAAYTVQTSSPILKNAVNNLTKADVTRITQGEKGALTQVLREKAYDDVVIAIMPKVDQKLNEFGLVNKINTVLKGNQMLGSFLGDRNNLATSSVSKLASKHIADGLFLLIEDYEKQNNKGIIGAL